MIRAESTAAIGGPRRYLKGLSRLHCRRYVDHYRRHGSYVRDSYTAAELRPYRVKVTVWIADHREHSTAKDALYAIWKLRHSADPQVEAFRFAGKPPAERANAACAALRERGVDLRRSWFVS